MATYLPSQIKGYNSLGTAILSVGDSTKQVNNALQSEKLTQYAKSANEASDVIDKFKAEMYQNAGLTKEIGLTNQQKAIENFLADYDDKDYGGHGNKIKEAFLHRGDGMTTGMYAYLNNANLIETFKKAGIKGSSWFGQQYTQNDFLNKDNIDTLRNYQQQLSTEAQASVDAIKEIMPAFLQSNKDYLDLTSEDNKPEIDSMMTNLISGLDQSGIETISGGNLGEISSDELKKNIRNWSSNLVKDLQKKDTQDALTSLFALDDKKTKMSFDEYEKQADDAVKKVRKQTDAFTDEQLRNSSGIHDTLDQLQTDVDNITSKFNGDKGFSEDKLKSDYTSSQLDALSSIATDKSFTGNWKAALDQMNSVERAAQLSADKMQKIVTTATSNLSTMQTAISESMSNTGVTADAYRQSALKAAKKNMQTYKNNVANRNKSKKALLATKGKITSAQRNAIKKNQKVNTSNVKDPKLKKQLEAYNKYVTASNPDKGRILSNALSTAQSTLTAAIAKRNQEKKEAQKILDGYNSQMSSMKISASINNADYGFTDEDKTVIYSLFHDQDYQNNNIVSTSVDTSVTEIDREKELYDDAVEKLSEVAQPQFKFTVSLDNLYRIEAFKHWQGELELLKFIRLGIRDDYSVKLRVTGITWNPCDVTEDLTLEFSNMITSRSGRTDLTELLDTENNRGSKNSISFGTGGSDSEKEYLSSMLQQLVKMGAFKTAVGNIAGSTTANLDEARINTLVSNFINASKIKVDNIEGDKGSFNEFFTKYLDSEVISTNLINGQNGDFIDFVNSHLNMKHITTELLQGETGTTFIDFVHNEMKTGTITADQIRSEDGKTFVDLVNGQIQAAKITTDQISGGDGTTFIDFLKNQISTSDITANQIKGWGDSQTLIDFVNNKITTSDISANKITGLNDSKTFIDFVNNQINTSVINSDLENVKNILAGNAGVGNLQSIHLTSANAVIDEAVIKQIIAAKISVADLMIHEATAEMITLISQDGKPSIAFKNSTQQFYDNNGNVRVQIGQDATGAFTFSLFDETGKGVLIDSKDGVHSGAIANGLIVNDMIQSGTVSKDKLNFPIVETDENGKISITNILDGKGNEFGVSYTEYQESVATELSSINSNLSGVSSTVSKIDKSITDKIWESDITTKINDYDQTTVKDIRDRTTSVEKNITGINSTVKDMQTTLESKADGTTVQSLTIRVSKAEQDMSGFKQTVESTYSTKSETESVNNYAKTSFEQLSDKFSWLVDGTSSSTSLTLTDSLVSAITNQFVIKSPDGTSTIIEGGKIKTSAITTDMLSSSVIKSKNYKEGTYVDGAGYSILGTFLDLDNGMIHTPGFYTDTIGNAYFNGTINALDGWFGTEQHNWYIGTTIITDIMNNDGALTGDEYSYLKATENAAIVVNEWHLQSQNDNMSLQSGLTTLNNGKFVLNPQDNKYYDFGIVKPDMSKDAKSYNKKFLYIRRADTPTTHPQDWEYLFHVDYDGSIWYKNQSIAGGNVFLSTTGGTIKGDLTVTGTLNATANQAKKVVNALSINGKAYDGSVAINVGSISIAYGGTGGTTVNEARANLGVLGANNKNGYYGLARPDGNDTDWIRSTVNGLIPYQSGIAGDGHSSLGTSTWYFSEAYIDFVHGSLKGTADRAICDDEGNKISSTYLKATSTEFDSITVGNMIVNGTARFVNGLMGTLTGNVIGNVSGSASYATSSDTANYINLVATNEIRFYKNQFKGGTVHFGYRWADGSTSPLITEYRFNNGNRSPTQVTASQFNGNLNGIATRTTLLNPVTTSDTFTTGTSTWRNGITDGYVVWGQWWKDTSFTNDTGDLTIWIRKEGAVTTANMTIDGTIYAVGGFNGNATSATKLQTARKIGNASFDGTADISLSSIGAASSGHTHNYASTLSLNGTNFTVTSNKITVSREQLLTAIGEVTKTANGYMSAADKAKLDNINISDIGTVGANSIKGSGYINVSILKGVATISHGTSGVTAGTYGADSTNNFTIPKIVVDSTGHITSASAYSVTAANIVSKLGTTAVNRATADSDGNAINSTYLKRSGGAMTGNISYQGTKATIEVIRFIDNKNDAYGNGIAIGAGGATIIGGGESSAFCQNSYIATGGDEKLILANDGAIDFYTNCQNNSTTDAAHVQIDVTGKFTGVSAQATQLETSRYIFGKLFNGTSDVAGQAMVYGWYNSNAGKGE